MAEDDLRTQLVRGVLGTDRVACCVSRSLRRVSLEEARLRAPCAPRPQDLAQTVRSDGRRTEPGPAAPAPAHGGTEVAIFLSAGPVQLVKCPF